MTPRRVLAVACTVALAATVLAVTTSATPRDEGAPASETATITAPPAIDGRMVWVPDRLLSHSLLVDGDTGVVLGMIDTPNQLMFAPPLFSPSRQEIYSADIVYARGTRGARSDFLTIYDAKTFRPVGEVDVPTRAGQSNVSYGYVELLGDRFVAVFNQFPMVSVSIIDLDARQFVEEIPIAGCSSIYPLSAGRFATLCGDGTALSIQLGEDGRAVARAASEPFFDPVEDPVFMPAGRDGQRYTFVSFGGQVHTVDFSGDRPLAAAPWSIYGEGGSGSGWRPGGLQHVAVSPSAKRLFVVMHEGGAGSHKAPGPEIWVFDMQEKRRIARFEAPNMTAAFIAGIAGIEPGTFSYSVMDWLLPADGVHTIAVTEGDQPLLFARNAERGAVAVMDGLTGETLRIVMDTGLAGATLRVP